MPIERIPADLKELYATAFEVDCSWLIEAAARRQKWIDQAQSLNLYMAEPSGKKLDDMYKRAWSRGLKTTYYLRTASATSAEKSTTNTGVLNAVTSNAQIAGNALSHTASYGAAKTVDADPGLQLTGKACLITDPECESCQ